MKTITPSTSRRFLPFWLLASAFCLLPSCSYTSKSLYNQSIHTIAVPNFGNSSFRREWDEKLSEAIKKNIEFRTPYKIAPEANADSVLTGQIVDIQENVLTRRHLTSIPRETEVTYIVNFTWKDLRSGRVIVQRKAFTRTATEIPQIGERVDNAEQLAVERLAAAIVDQLQADW